MTEFTAADARNISDEYKKCMVGKLATKYDEIIVNIKYTASSSTDREIWIYKNLEEPIVRRLELNDFIVKTTYDQRDGYSTKISWVS